MYYWSATIKSIYTAGYYTCVVIQYVSPTVCRVLTKVIIITCYGTWFVKPKKVNNSILKKYDDLI